MSSKIKVTEENLWCSLAAFNSSPRANRITVEDFMQSYIKAYPEREKILQMALMNIPDLYDQLYAMLSRNQSLNESCTDKQYKYWLYLYNKIKGRWPSITRKQKAKNKSKKAMAALIKKLQDQLNKGAK